MVCCEIIYLCFEKVCDIFLQDLCTKNRGKFSRKIYKQQGKRNFSILNSSAPSQNIKTRTSGVAIFSKTFYLLRQQKGVANGTSKNVGLGKFWQDLEISETFLIEVSFFSWFVFPLFESRNFLPKSLWLGFLTRISASRQVSDFTIRHP